MTTKQLYKRIKDGYIYGKTDREGFIWRTLWREGDYIYFRPNGQFACRCTQKEFLSNFHIAWKTMSDFLISNNDITTIVYQ